MSEKAKPRSRRESPGKHKPPVLKPDLLLKVVWGGVITLFLISLSIWLYLSWYKVQEHCLKSPQTRDVKVSLFGPKFLPVDDNAEFVVTAINERSIPAELSVDLRYTGTFLCAAGDGQSLRANFGPVQPGERVSRKLTVLFPSCLESGVFQNWPRRQVELEVWLTVDAQPPERIETVAWPVAPLPRTRTLEKLTRVWLAGLGLWTGKELWDQIKKEAQSSLPKTRRSTT